jgi:predicted XRE-type DNA-binding protein
VAGRPRKELNAEQVHKLARLGCTQEEIADILGCSQATISERFSIECSHARAELKMSLRRAQVHRATKDRSDTMLIHLGKVYLGQGTTIDSDALRDLLTEALHGGPVAPGAGEVPG